MIDQTCLIIKHADHNNNSSQCIYNVSESSGFTLVHNYSYVLYCQRFAVHAIDREHQHDDSRFSNDRQIGI